MREFIEKMFSRKTGEENEDEEIQVQEHSEKFDDIYSADSPISNPDLDEFNRRGFSERIAQTIAARKESKSLVIGIYGKWGEGKTTVLNFIDAELKNHENVVTLTFNPWLFPSETELLIAFYSELSTAIGKSLTTGKEEAGKFIKEYVSALAGFFDKSGAVEKIGGFLSDVRLEELRDRIGNFLRDQKKLVVVLMDDIDRLDKDEIHAVFRIIKLSANLENVIYVLAFDREVIEEALSERYVSKKDNPGQSFIEKIVQVPINLPKVPKTDLRNFCYKQIDKALQSNGIEISENDVQEFGRGFITGVEIRLETPRMAIRYGNMLNFSLPLMKGEVHLAEFLLVEAIRAFYPNAYEIIKENRDAFTAVNLGSMTPLTSVREEINNIVKKAFDGLTEDETNNLKRLITILFPRLQNTIYGPEWDKTWTEEKRISSEKYFDRYFTYSIPLGDVSDIRIENFIKTLKDITQEELVKILDNELTSQNAEAFISKLHQKIERISHTGQLKLAISLSLFGNRLPNPKELFSFRSPFSRGALLVAYLIEAQETDDDKYRLSIEVINVAEPITFALETVRWLRRKETENSAISPDNLKKINNALANRIEVLSEKGIDFFDEYQDQAPHLLWYWKEFGKKENADKYLTEYLTSDIKNVHKLLNSMVPIAYPMNGSPPHKSDFKRSQYDYLKSIVNPNLIDKVLKSEYGKDLESEHFPREFGKSNDLLFAKQFVWLYNHVKIETEKDKEETSENE